MSKFKAGDKVVVNDRYPDHRIVGTKGEIEITEDSLKYIDLRISLGTRIIVFEDEIDFDPDFIPTEHPTFIPTPGLAEYAAEGYPDDNPKTAIGVTKVPLHLVPPSAKHYLAAAFSDGAKKYGPYNWRDKTVSSSVYIGAAQRHIDAWWDGEDLSADAKVHHLAHAMACLAIVLDAANVSKLNDDRPTKGGVSTLQAQWGQG